MTCPLSAHLAQLDAARGSQLFTAVEVTVAGSGQLLCQLQIMHVRVWRALHDAFTPVELRELQHAGYVLTNVVAEAEEGAGGREAGGAEEGDRGDAQQQQVQAQADHEQEDHDGGGADQESPVRGNSASPRAKLSRAQVLDRKLSSFTLQRQ
jgi:hypothetical protein